MDEIDGWTEVDAAWLLRRWRTNVAGIKHVVEAAHRFGVSNTLWSGWETGERIKAEQVTELDKFFQAHRAFEEIVWATTTTRALKARRDWSQNLQGESASWWVWLRHADATNREIQATVRWGPAVVRIDDHAPRGLVLTTPVSIPNPPVEVHLDSPGWADFGRGEIPPGLGLASVSGVRRMRAPIPDPATWIVSQRIRRLIGHVPGWQRVVADLLSDSPFVKEALEIDEDPWTGRALDLSSISEVGEARIADPVPGEEFRRVRKARHLYRKGVCSSLNDLDPSEPVSYDQLKRFEENSEPLTPNIRPRLDLVFGAGGSLCRDAIHVAHLRGTTERDTWRADFPKWWFGPVWVRADQRDSGYRGPGDIDLTWHPWTKRVRVRTGQVLALTKASTESEPLRIDAPAGWAITAGMGRALNAQTVNHQWRLTDDHAAHQLWSQLSDVYLAAFGKNRGDAARVAFAHRRKET